MTKVVISLGSNLEPRKEFLQQARVRLGELGAIVKASAVIETEPVEVPPEFKDLKFLNQLLVMDTDLPPEEFSRAMHQIEDDLGRVRTVKNGPRTIDIDMLDYEGVKMDTPELTLPHPRAWQRDFVKELWKTL